MMIALRIPDGIDPRIATIGRANVMNRIATSPIASSFPVSVPPAFVSFGVEAPARKAVLSVFGLGATLSARLAVESAVTAPFFASLSPSALNARGEYARPTDQYVSTTASTWNRRPPFPPAPLRTM
jgi:hypothetical protein